MTFSGGRIDKLIMTSEISPTIPYPGSSISLWSLVEFDPTIPVHSVHLDGIPLTQHYLIGSTHCPHACTTVKSANTRKKK